MYTFKKIDKEILNATKKEWKAQTDSLGDLGVLLHSDISRKLHEISENTDGSNYHAYFLVADGSGHASAILDIIHARPGLNGSWIKLLDITLEPRLSLECANQEGAEVNFPEIGIVIGHAISHSINLLSSDFKEVGTLKIYGRTIYMDAIFTGILSTNSDFADVLAQYGLNAKKEGRWLIVAKT